MIPREKTRRGPSGDNRPRLDPFQEECDVADILVVQSKIREMIKGKGCSTSADAVGGSFH